MNREEKYAAIKEMESIGQLTKGEYPSKTAFFRALAYNLVTGTYGERIVTTSSDPRKEYTFVKYGVSRDRHGIRSIQLPHSKKAGRILREAPETRPEWVARFYELLASEGSATYPDMPGYFFMRGGKVCYHSED